MNPEFQRNLWLEAGPRRLAWTGVVLAALYGSVLLLARDHAVWALGGAGAAVFVASSLIWGARAAGGAVAEEVRQRTWDFQRLSALTPWEMAWGKLFGATLAQWFGGAICLPFILAPVWIAQGPRGALTYAVILVALGVFAAIVNLQVREAPIPRGGAMPQPA